MEISGLGINHLVSNETDDLDNSTSTNKIILLVSGIALLLISSYFVSANNFLFACFIPVGMYLLIC
jgi:hypothetical protein